MKRFHKPSCILLDWDGTIIDSIPTIHQSINAVMQHFNRPELSLEDVRTGVHRSGRELFPMVFGADADIAKQIYFKAFAARHMQALNFMPYAESFLKFVLSKNIPMAVVSNKTGKYLRKEVSHLNLDSYFFNVVGAEDATHDKPHPAVIQHTFQNTDFKADSTIWYIGDTETDMQCAHQNNLFGVLVRDLTPKKQEFAECEPHLYVESLQLLTNCLQEAC